MTSTVDRIFFGLDVTRRLPQQHSLDHFYHHSHQHTNERLQTFFHYCSVFWFHNQQVVGAPYYLFRFIISHHVNLCNAFDSICTNRCTRFDAPSFQRQQRRPSFARRNGFGVDRHTCEKCRLGYALIEFLRWRSLLQHACRRPGRFRRRSHCSSTTRSICRSSETRPARETDPGVTRYAEKVYSRRLRSRQIWRWRRQWRISEKALVEDLVMQPPDNDGLGARESEEEVIPCRLTGVVFKI